MLLKTQGVINGERVVASTWVENQAVDIKSLSLHECLGLAGDVAPLKMKGYPTMLMKTKEDLISMQGYPTMLLKTHSLRVLSDDLDENKRDSKWR